MVSAALVLTGLLEISYWVVALTVGLGPATPLACYAEHERAFLVPDLVVATSMIIAGVLAKRGHPLARSLAVACGGALFFLGLLDASFNLQNGVYDVSEADLWLNAGLNAYCMIFGALLVGVGGRSLRLEAAHG